MIDKIERENISNMFNRCIVCTHLAENVFVKGENNKE